MAGGDQAGQDTAAIGVTIQLWDAPPDDVPGEGWARTRELTVELPQGARILEDISSGPVPLEPGGIERITLPGGAGAYHVRACHSGREQAAAAVAQLWEADQAGEDIAAVYAGLAGLERYLLQIWAHES
jgi:hypothetical protein